jgi:hypothetical protein
MITYQGRSSAKAARCPTQLHPTLQLANQSVLSPTPPTSKPPPQRMAGSTTKVASQLTPKRRNQIELVPSIYPSTQSLQNKIKSTRRGERRFTNLRSAGDRRAASTKGAGGLWAGGTSAGRRGLEPSREEVTCGGLQRRRGWGNCARGRKQTRRRQGRQGKKGPACVSGDVTGSRRGIVWEGNRFVRSVYPRVSSCVGVALIAKESGIAMACAWDRPMISLLVNC